MPPRPSLKVKPSRPLSAVYIGKGPYPHPDSGSSSGSFTNNEVGGTPPNLPDLPDLPSPGSSPGSMKSGLPSPPATNSTGSGSTGDPATVAIRGRYDGSSLDVRSYNAGYKGGDEDELQDREGEEEERRMGNVNENVNVNRHDDEYGDEVVDDDDDDDDDEDDENNQDEDDKTARMDKRLLVKSSSENVMALQRVRSLAHRNRLALDKLSRLSPSPARSNSNSLSRSPLPQASTSSSSSSSRLSSSSSRQSRSSSSLHLSSPQGRSGSETERESVSAIHDTATTYSSHSSSSPSSSFHRHPSHSTSSLNLSLNDSPTHSASRNRQVSTPSSPRHNRLTGSGQSPTSRRRKRASLASMSNFHLTDFEEEDAEDLKASTGTARERDRMTADNTNNNTSAGATNNNNRGGESSSSTARDRQRGSPVNGTGTIGARRRSALPREFRSDLADEVGGTTSLSRLGRRSVTGGYDDNPTQEPITPYRDTTLGRSSTLRETRRISTTTTASSNPRWSTDDLRTPATVRDRTVTPSYSNEDNRRRERHQSLRGGSAESALMWSPGGRSLLGEGLRAAGLIKDDGVGSVGRRGVGGVQDVFRDRDGERRAQWSRQDVLDEGRRRVLGDGERERGVGERYPPRAATSMAQYASLEDHDTSPESRLNRAHRSTYSLVTRDPDASNANTARRAGSALNMNHRYSTSSTYSPLPVSVHLQDRMGGSRRYSALPNSSASGGHHQIGSGGLNQSMASGEHVRLMQDSLNVFESQLSKISSLHSSTSSTTATSSSQHHDLIRSAHSLVSSLISLSSTLRSHHAENVEKQVDVEVDGDERVFSAEEVGEMMRRFAGEGREGMKVVDDVIRGVTGVMLGVGRVLRDVGGGMGASMGGGGGGGGERERGGGERNSPMVHARQMSVDEYEYDHAVIGGGGEGASGRQSVTSRRSLEGVHRERDVGHREREREEALKRLAGGGHTHSGGGGGGGGQRSESVLARASPATFQRLRDRDGRENGRDQHRESGRDQQTQSGRDQQTQSGRDQQRESLTSRDSHRESLRERDREAMQETPSRPPRHSQSTSGVERRLITPREQRDVMLVSELGEMRGGPVRMGGMSTFDSQETVQAAPGSSGREYGYAYGSGSGSGSGYVDHRDEGYVRGDDGYAQYAYEPSPTPASRQLNMTLPMTKSATSTPLERVRMLPGTPLEGTRRLTGTPLEGTKRLPGTPLEGTKRLPGTPLEGTKRLPGTPLEGSRKLPTTPLEGSRKLPPLDIPKPIAVLPSERRGRGTMDSSTNSSSGGGSNGGSGTGSSGTGTRRRLTIRGTAPVFPTLTTPSNAAAVLTPHTVSNSPVSDRARAGGVLVRSESSKSGTSGLSGGGGVGGGRTQVTFSRPEGGVEAQLTDHLDKARKRTLSASGASGGGGGGGGVMSPPAGNVMLTPVSGPETHDRESRRRTLGGRVMARGGVHVLGNSDVDDVGREGRDSVQSAAAARVAAAAVVHAADRSAASRILQPTQSSAARGSPRERRRTVTDVFPA